ncbi:hypothetical protein ACK3YP_01125 [Aeromonas allosaccharophila]|uniref:hypothetical protein n=1 Tax=Aeromonas allosaccharophila TaxID=656 RepID=UPI0039888628
MKHLSALMFSLFFLIACDHTTVATSTGENSSSSSSSSEGEVSLSGDNGHAFLGEDEIALKNGKVFINGKASATAPSGAVVTYVVKNNFKSLYVNEALIPLKNQHIP